MSWRVGVQRRYKRRRRSPPRLSHIGSMETNFFINRISNAAMTLTAKATIIARDAVRLSARLDALEKREQCANIGRGETRSSTRLPLGTAFPEAPSRWTCPRANQSRRPADLLFKPDDKCRARADQHTQGLLCACRTRFWSKASRRSYREAGRQSRAARRRKVRCYSAAANPEWPLPGENRLENGKGDALRVSEPFVELALFSIFSKKRIAKSRSPQS